MLWRTFLRRIIGVKFVNRHTLKSYDQFIIIANHNSHLDSMAIMSSMPMQIVHKVHPIAAEDFFGDKSTKEFMMKNFINAVLIPRNKPEKPGDPDPLQIMSDLLNKGESIILFPEGTRGEPGVMQKFKAGIALMVQRHPDIPVIPVYLDGLHKSMPKGINLMLPSNSKLYVGDAISFRSLDKDVILEDALDAILSAHHE